MKRAAVFGGSGFIGSHLCARLVADGYEVTAYDRKQPEFGWKPAHEYRICDLRLTETFAMDFSAAKYDELYQLAAEMGGAGFVFSGDNDAGIMSSSALININAANLAISVGKRLKVFFASSACVYQSLEKNCEDYLSGKKVPSYYIACREDEGINPDSDYGLEKLFAEKLYDAHHRNHGLNIRIGRFHNVFGPYGTWKGGREKAPAALCRKIAETRSDELGFPATIDVWGNGQQTRSFLYVDEAVEAVIRLMHSDYKLPVNIGSPESVTIDQLAQIIAAYAGKEIKLNHIPGPLGVDGRNSDNTLIEHVLGWKPTMRLIDGLRPTYDWIKQEVDKLPDAI